MTFDSMIQSMNHSELISYLDGLISRLEADELQDEQAGQLAVLMRKIRQELSEDGEAAVNIPIYKVCFVRGKMERQAEYFISLRKAKKELRRRLKEIMKQPNVALPCEIIRCGLSEGIAPGNTKSVVSNAGLKARAPGRFKFYEIRTMHRSKDLIVPIQLVLSQIHLQPGVRPQHNDHEKRGVVLQFPR